MGYQDTIVESFTMGVEDHQYADPSQDYFDRWSYELKRAARSTATGCRRQPHPSYGIIQE